MKSTGKSNQHIFLVCCSVILLFITTRTFSQKWESLGPNNFPKFQNEKDYNQQRAAGIGRVGNVRFFGKKSNQTIAVGTPYGGFFLSKKNKIKWQHISVDAPVGGIADVLFASSKNIFVLTGDADCIIDRNLPALGCESCQSHGIYQSKDGGKTFSGPIGNWYDTSGNIVTDFWQFPSLKVARRLIQTSKKVFYTIIHTYDPSTRTYDGMIYYSVDAGLNWYPSLILKDGYLKDLEFMPGNKSIVYAGGRNLYRSLDGGMHWNKLTALPEDSLIERMEIAVSPLQPDYVWVLVVNQRSRQNELYRSMDRGTTFTKAGILAKSPEWRTCMAIDANDANRIYASAANKPVVIFYDGKTFKVESSPAETHDDVHEITVDPFTGDVYASTDGGLYISSNKGKNYRFISNGMNVAECWGIGVSQTDPERIMCGLQDCGTQIYTPGDTAAWTIIKGGDGMDCIIDPNNAELIYYNDGNNNIFARSSDGGKTWSKNFTVRGKPANYRRPFALNPVQSKSVYTGYTQLYKSISQGDSLFPLSELKKDKEENVQAFAIAPGDTNTIYLAYSNPCWNEEISGKFFVTHNEGKDWIDITRGLNGVKWWCISSVVVDPSDANSVYVGFTGASKIKLMHSDDGGKHWRDISSNLPANGDVNCMLFDPKSRILFIGTHTGVWQKNDHAPEWKKTGENLPAVMVSELEIRNSSNELYAGTHGCGVWKIKLSGR